MEGTASSRKRNGPRIFTVSPPWLARDLPRAPSRADHTSIPSSLLKKGESPSAILYRAVFARCIFLFSGFPRNKGEGFLAAAWNDEGTFAKLPGKHGETRTLTRLNSTLLRAHFQLSRRFARILEPCEPKPPLHPLFVHWNKLCAPVGALEQQTTSR